ncbi:hypothetical protein HAPAU_38700 [Halalkalicoccus paucihalophilus]|uniref:Uncharacterized protein n=1 Tax=Halalkalicoccus paucihalophilus TaxID=1008153 RepID=A0A151A7Y6_9EURY|nr:hypothetical protein HAPAU_38700 [Halalkalicoccus paucihalophilus]
MSMIHLAVFPSTLPDQAAKLFESSSKSSFRANLVDMNRECVSGLCSFNIDRTGNRIPVKCWRWGSERWNILSSEFSESVLE